MSEKALVAQRFVLDLGPYAAVLALFAAWVSYRANPLRAVNRYFAAYLLGIALWQIHVALARSTQNYGFWGPLATPYGMFLGVLVFLLYDAAIEPHALFRSRVKRNPSASLSAVVFMIGAALVFTAQRAPEFYPFHYRVICTLIFPLQILATAQKGRDRTGRVNPSELILLLVSAVYSVLVYTVFLLVRSPAGSRILSGTTIVFMVGVIAMQLSERILDVRGSAKIAMGYLVTVVVHSLLTMIPISVFLMAGGEFTETTAWGFLVLGGLMSYPLFVFVQGAVRRSLSSLTARPADDAREAVVEVAANAEKESTILARVSAVSKSFLKGQDVAIELYSAELHEAAGLNSGRRLLAERAHKGWLSPEGALRQFWGEALDRILTVFAEERLGALIKKSGPRFSLLLFVSERSGGTRPITGEEIELLQELAAIAATGIERVRALEQALRAHGLAQVGRIAAQFSHESRNQIEAILCVLEALRDGQEGRITPPHRAAVYQQAADLAANHNLALEMVRLRPERIETQRVDLRAAVTQSAVPFQSGTVEISVQAKTPGDAYADGRLLRQVLLNLFRNSVQASLVAGTPARVDVQFGRGDGFAFVDVIDHGPGVPAEIHDALFARWTTTKSDGTGLGLAFCREAMNAMKGEIFYLTPKGQAGAHFRLALPCVAVADHPLRAAGR